MPYSTNISPKYGGSIPNIVRRVIEHYEQTTQWRLFPNYHAGYIDAYLRKIQDTQQFRIILDEQNGFAGYADYWLFEEEFIDIVKDKAWVKPWPKDISTGNIAYCYFLWIRPDLRGSGLSKKVIKEFRHDFPEYHLAYHVAEQNMRFVHLDPIGENNYAIRSII